MFIFHIRGAYWVVAGAHGGDGDCDDGQFQDSDDDGDDLSEGRLSGYSASLRPSDDGQEIEKSVISISRFLGVDFPAPKVTLSDLINNRVFQVVVLSK